MFTLQDRFFTAVSNRNVVFVFTTTNKVASSKHAIANNSFVNLSTSSWHLYLTLAYTSGCSSFYGHEKQVGVSSF